MTDFLRQLDILSPREIIYPTTVIGCGGIGSPLALTLAKMGWPRLTLMDDDRIEPHNLPNQLYRLDDLGGLKVDALASMICSFANCQVTALAERFDGSQKLEGIVVSGVDSMAARQTIWDNIKWNVNVPLYVDCRIGGTIIMVFMIRPCQIEDIELYESRLCGDDQVAELPCTARAIMFTGFSIAGLAASQIKKWLKQQPVKPYVCLDLQTLILQTQ